MNPLFREFLYAILRHLLAGVFSGLVARGILTEEQGAAMMVGLIGFLIVLGWSLWQKYGARLKLMVALATPKGTTEKQAETIVKAGDAPSTTLPKTAVPKLPRSVISGLRP